MNVKPKFVYYDIRRKQSVCLIMYTHENDVDTQVLEVSMLDNGDPIELDADYTYSAAIVNRNTKALINDSISCELNDSGNVLIPIDNFHTLGAQDLLIELTITDSAGDQVLVTPFPLWIHVNASILDDAQVTPESEGTVPELIEEAKEALESAGDYENLENKPQINGHELVGNKSSDDLGLQGKLTAGENVTIDENGRISASGGVTSYTELSDKPQIEEHDSYGRIVDLTGKVRLPEGISIDNGTEGIIALLINNYAIEGDNIALRTIPFNRLTSEVYNAILKYKKFESYQLLNLQYSSANSVQIFGNDLYNNSPPYEAPSDMYHYSLGTAITLCTVDKNSNNKYVLTQFYAVINEQHNKCTLFVRNGLNSGTPGTGRSTFDNWIEVNPTIVSAVVNQNGTITFTMSDGSTVTTTGESVIGPQGPAGADGNDYVLTNQDKSDIADLVLAQLPTTQGVQYGNSND